MSRIIDELIYEDPNFLELEPLQRDYYTYLLLYADNEGVVDYYKAGRTIGITNKKQILMRLQPLVQFGFVRLLQSDRVVIVHNFAKFNRGLAGRKYRQSEYAELIDLLDPPEERLQLQPRSQSNLPGLPAQSQSAQPAQSQSAQSKIHDFAERKNDANYYKQLEAENNKIDN